MKPNPRQSQQPPQKRNPFFFAVTTLILILTIGGVVLWLNSGYGKVGGDAYEIAKALYATCLAKSDDRLEAIIALMKPDAQLPMQLTDQERQWLEEIIDQASGGQWETAAQAARQMLEDQVDQPAAN